MRWCGNRGIATASGCGPAKLNQSKTFTLDAGDTQSIDLDAQPKPQKITIEFASSAGDVVVYVFKESDAKGDRYVRLPRLQHSDAYFLYNRDGYYR